MAAKCKHFVHRYKWSHASKRRVFKRLLDNNHVELLETQSDGWLYKEINVDITVSRKGIVQCKLKDTLCHQ